MDTINKVIDECESDYCSSNQSIFKNILTDITSDLASFDSFMWIEDAAKKDYNLTDFWANSGSDDFSNNDYLLDSYQVDNGNDSWSSHEELIESDYSDSMSSNTVKSNVKNEEIVKEEELPIGLTTITLYTEDSKSKNNFSATINAFEIHNYSCNYRQENEKNEEKNLSSKNVNSNYSTKNNSSNRKINCKSSKPQTLIDFKLTEEEKRLLIKEGYVDFPSTKTSLTKQEVKILRKIRRKIRNKRSAQCSRQRKKQYLEELEKKFEECTNERDCLKKEVTELRKENESLLMKMKKMVSKSYLSHGQASYKTSLFVLLISFLFILMPCFRPDGIDDGLISHSVGEKIIGTGRNLLHLSSSEHTSNHYSINDSEASTIELAQALRF